MPKLSDPRITKGHAVSFLIRLYLQEPEFLKELHQVRQQYFEPLKELMMAQVKFFTSCNEVLSTEEHRKMYQDLYEWGTEGSSGPTVPANLTRQLKRIMLMYRKLGPYFHDLEQLVSRWKLRASWAGPILHLYDLHNFFKVIGMATDAVDVPLDQLDLLYPWPAPLAPLEIKVSAWAFVFDGRKQIQAEIAKKLEDYEDQLKAVGLKEKPSALEVHARWWFEHFVRGKTYRELEQQFPRVGQETIKRKVWEFTKLAEIKVD